MFSFESVSYRCKKQKSMLSVTHTNNKQNLSAVLLVLITHQSGAFLFLENLKRAPPKEVRKMKRDLYFKELAVALGRAGFTPLPQENDSLPVEYHSQRLCRINEQGNVFYREEEVDSPEREKACAKATDIAGTVLEYMNHLEHTPTLKAAGLSEPYQSLAEFNGTVLAGRLTEKGAKFVTWDWDFNHTGLNHGHYYEGDYVGAKRDFAIRSGLIPDERQFTTEQLIEVYQQSAYIRFSCSLPAEQEQTIEQIQQRIQELVPDFEERITKEMEATADPPFEQTM